MDQQEPRALTVTFGRLLAIDAALRQLAEHRLPVNAVSLPVARTLRETEAAMARFTARRTALYAEHADGADLRPVSRGLTMGPRVADEAAFDRAYQALLAEEIELTVYPIDFATAKQHDVPASVLVPLLDLLLPDEAPRAPAAPPKAPAAAKKSTSRRRKA